MISAQSELSGPAYVPLWTVLRKRLESNGLTVSGHASVATFDAVSRRAVQALTGTSSTRVELAVVDGALRAAVGCGLVDWLERLGPPLRDRVAERDERARRRATVEALAADHRIAARPWFDDWLTAVRRDGAMAAAARLEERRYLEAALDVLAAVLDAHHERVPFATIVAGATGDTKRLGSATVRAMVEQALALELGVERPTTSAQRRLLWRQFGVVIDDVSSDVLVLNLRPSGDTLLARWLRDAADVGQPFRVTLRQAASMELSWDVGSNAPIGVCENPAVVMDAAARFGASCAPLICTDGVPSDAFWTIADRIAVAVGAMRVHADFDAAGCSIAGAVIARCAAVPWRFDAVSYRRGLDRWGAAMMLPPSKGTVPDTPWDPELASLLRDDGRALYEELVVDDLFADLADLPDVARPRATTPVSTPHES